MQAFRKQMNKGWALPLRITLEQKTGTVCFYSAFYMLLPGFGLEGAPN